MSGGTGGGEAYVRTLVEGWWRAWREGRMTTPDLVAAVGELAADPQRPLEATTQESLVLLAADLVGSQTSRGDADTEQVLRAHLGRPGDARTPDWSG